jgi:hypothetical protein
MLRLRSWTFQTEQDLERLVGVASRLESLKVTELLRDEPRLLYLAYFMMDEKEKERVRSFFRDTLTDVQKYIDEAKQSTDQQPADDGAAGPTP